MPSFPRAGVTCHEGNRYEQNPPVAHDGAGFLRHPSWLALVLTVGLVAPSAQAADLPAQTLTPEETKAIATDAYIYGYSLITTDVTRVQMSNVPKVEGLHAPAGQFINVPRYPPADYRGVSAPNADTLYPLAWLDLGREPMVFTHPDMGKRYFLFPMYSLWMPVIESAGSRTTGEKAQTFLISGPGWSGEVPEGMTHIKVPTRYMVILGRTYADGTEEDYKAVNALQAQYNLRPLSAVGKADYVFEAPPVDPNPGFSMTDKPQQVILDMGTKGYFDRMTKLMCKDAPPAPEDAPMLARIAKIGIESCKPFDIEANWLPAPKGDLLPMLRMYWPKEKSPPIIDGTWTPPKVEKVQWRAHFQLEMRAVASLARRSACPGENIPSIGRLKPIFPVFPSYPQRALQPFTPRQAQHVAHAVGFTPCHDGLAAEPGINANHDPLLRPALANLGDDPFKLIDTARGRILVR